MSPEDEQARKVDQARDRLLKAVAAVNKMRYEGHASEKQYNALMDERDAARSALDHLSRQNSQNIR